MTAVICPGPHARDYAVAFPLGFPWFGEARYWERHVAELEEQVFAVGGI